jgi:membrane-bound inhibitor of C-type lysozyme
MLPLLMSARNKITITIIIVSLIILTAAAFWYRAHAPLESTRTFITTATYTCDKGKRITASYYHGPEAPKSLEGESASSSQDGPPTPTGSVDVSIDGAARTTLAQTLSADGARYANSDESLVLWNKGTTALIMRNNTMDLNYTNCAIREAVR